MNQGWHVPTGILLVLGVVVAGCSRSSPAPQETVASRTAPPPARVDTPRTVAEAAPLIAVAADGNVTLRVEQRPLEWVLEQIALQTGASVGELRRSMSETAAPPRAAPAVAHADAADACTVAAAPAPGAEQLLGTIQRGDEASRHDALLRARGAGIAVPDDTLKTLFETDASDRVRLLAFESWLETRQDNAEVMRGALQSALLLPSAAIQQEAQRLLAQLHDVERTNLDAVQSTDP